MGKVFKYVIVGLFIYLTMPNFGIDKFGSLCFAAFMSVCLYFIQTDDQESSDDENTSS